MKTKRTILETNRKIKENGQLIEIVDIFDTRGQASPVEWERVALKVRRADAEQIVADHNSQEVTQ